MLFLEIFHYLMDPKSIATVNWSYYLACDLLSPQHAVSSCPKNLCQQDGTTAASHEIDELDAGYNDLVLR